MLRIEHLTKRYGPKTAVDDLSLKIHPGEICGFIGHNGAGKTTTLKCVAGIHPFEEGEILVNSLSITRDALACKRIMAYIPDNPDLYDYMTGIQYLGFIADIFGMSAQSRESAISRYTQLFGLWEHLSKPIRAYSHGMKQKLALTAAFFHDPLLIIMDEPFVGLDPTASYTLKRLMREFCDKGGAIFFSTHVLDVAEKLCDQVAILQEGKLICSGPMRDVIADRSLEHVFLNLQGMET